MRTKHAHQSRCVRPGPEPLGKATITVAAAACLDIQPPVAPGGFTQIAATTDAVVLGWSPSSDDVGVVDYAVYRNLQRVATTAEPNVTLSGLTCGSTYSYLVDAADAAGNRSLQTTVYVRTADCVRVPNRHDAALDAYRPRPHERHTDRARAELERGDGQHRSDRL